MDGWLVMVWRHFEHASSGCIMLYHHLIDRGVDLFLKSKKAKLMLFLRRYFVVVLVSSFSSSGE